MIILSFVRMLIYFSKSQNIFFAFFVKTLAPNSMNNILLFSILSISHHKRCVGPIPSFEDIGKGHKKKNLSYVFLGS